MYCSVECQKKDWPHHKGVCGNGFAPAVTFTRPPYVGKTAPTPRLRQQIILLEKFGEIYDYFLLRDGQAQKGFILDDPNERGAFQRVRHMALSGGRLVDGRIPQLLDTLRPDDISPEVIADLKQNGRPDWTVKLGMIKQMASFLKESTSSDGEMIGELEWRYQLADEYGFDRLGPGCEQLYAPSVRDLL